MPEVTIGLPVYNAELYLEECIRSILAQTYSEFEVVAVLDAPTDRSEAILRDLADSRFRILANPGNLGLCRTCNVILEQARTSLVARMDTDDIMLPERIEQQYRFMSEHPETDVLGTRFIEIDERGRKLREPFPLPLEHEDILESFRIRSVVHHPTVMYRKESVLAAGAYDPDIRYAEDLSLWFRCMIRGSRFANLEAPLLQYRVHHRQLMSRKLEPTLQNIDRLYAEYGPQIWGDRAPDYVSGRNPWHRLWRRLKRRFREHT